MSIQRELKQSKPFVSPASEVSVALLRTADVTRRALCAVVEPHGITLQQYNVLRILRGAGEGGLPTLEIALRMIEETPGITRLLDRLEAKGLVARKRCATDRRQVFCRITRSGIALLESLDVPLRTAEEAALAELAPRTLGQLLNILEQVRNGYRGALPARRPEHDREIA